MKRYRLPALLLALLLCVSGLFYYFYSVRGAGENREPPAAPKAFQTNILVSFHEKVLEADYAQQSLGHGSFTITSPETLTGIQLMMDGTKCTVQYKGMAFEADLSKLPESAFGGIVMEALGKKLDGAEISRAYKDGKWRYEGNAQAGDFLLVQDAETGCYEFLTIPVIDLRVEFRDFQIRD